MWFAQVVFSNFLVPFLSFVVKREESRGHGEIKDLPWSHYAEHVDHVLDHVSNEGGPH